MKSINSIFIKFMILDFIEFVLKYTYSVKALFKQNNCKIIFFNIFVKWIEPTLFELHPQIFWYQDRLCFLEKIFQRIGNQNVICKSNYVWKNWLHFFLVIHRVSKFTLFSLLYFCFSCWKSSKDRINFYNA